jgi:hypothetical protein
LTAARGRGRRRALRGWSLRRRGRPIELIHHLCRRPRWERCQGRRRWLLRVARDTRTTRRRRDARDRCSLTDFSRVAPSSPATFRRDRACPASTPSALYAGLSTASMTTRPVLRYRPSFFSAKVRAPASSSKRRVAAPVSNRMRPSPSSVASSFAVTEPPGPNSQKIQWGSFGVP